MQQIQNSGELYSEIEAPQSIRIQVEGTYVSGMITLPPTMPVSNNRALEIQVLEMHAKSLAFSLLQTLERLKQYHEEAIYPILELLEPYTNPNQHLEQTLYAKMPPKSSRSVTMNVTRHGKAQPKAYLD